MAKAKATAGTDGKSEPGAMVAGPGEVLVGIFDSDRITETIVAVPIGEATFRMVYQGQNYDRFDTAADGRVQYAPLTTR